MSDQVFVLLDLTAHELEFVGVFSSRERALEEVEGNNDMTAFIVQPVTVDVVSTIRAEAEERRPT